jgi:hypothetical protein
MLGTDQLGFKKCLCDCVRENHWRGKGFGAKRRSTVEEAMMLEQSTKVLESASPSDRAAAEEMVLAMIAAHFM